MFRMSICAALVAAALAMPAAASQHGSAKLHYADLNLSSDAGRATFERRLDKAARIACAAYPTRILTIEAAGKRCMKQAIAEARPAVDAVLARAGTTMVARADTPILLKGAR